MRILIHTPERYAGSELESIARALNIAFIIFPAFFFIVFVRQILQSDWDMATILGIAILATFGIRQLFLHGELQRSMMTVAVFFNILLTAVCSLGNGIHDIGLIGFPIIIGFSSIILDQKQLIIASILSILGLSWLVVGEQFNWYTPHPVTMDASGDFLVSGLLICIGGFVAFSLTRNMKASLKKAQREIEVSKNEADHLAQQIEQKEEIIEEIHNAVINSLGHIRQLIEHNPNDNDELIAVHDSLKRKIIVIEAAHGILLEDKAPILLDVTELTREVLARYEKKLTTPILHIDIDTTSCIISLDQAIHFGIFLIELIHKVDQNASNSLAIRLSIKMGNIELKLSGFENGDRDELGVVMELLTKQLKGSLSRSPNEIVFTFQPSMKK
ncbi:hypothetical protein [Ekhidna sp.]|uniref:hypothetical protein n=1 Tax=Ekhidna sp. TaxID=2608089 RepID=UPI003B5CBDF3